MPERSLSDGAMRRLAGLFLDAQADQPQAARAAIQRGLVEFGLTFFEFAVIAARREPAAYAPVLDLSIEVTKSWLNGDTISNKPNENERRARFAIGMMKLNPQLTRLAANAVFALPEGHVLRDAAAIKTALLEMLNSATGTRYPDLGAGPAAENLGSALDAAAGLIEHALLDPDEVLVLIEHGERWADAPHLNDRGREFRRNAAFVLARAAIAARDAGDDEKRRACLARARAISRPILGDGPAAELSREDRLWAALLEELEIEGRGDARGFSSLANLARATAGKRDDIALLSARITSRAHYRAARYSDVVDLLAPVLPILEQRYLTAVAADAVSDSGNDFGEASINLAFALAQLGRWPEALTTLDRAKSLRLRYQAILRASAAGRHVLEFEAALLDHARGLPPRGNAGRDAADTDPVAADLTLHARLVEAYRSLRDSPGARKLASPNVRAIARCLDRDEAALVLGLAHTGVLIALIGPRDTQVPERTEMLRGDLATRLINVLADAEQGWIIVSQTPELAADARPALTRLLTEIDEILGKKVSAMLARRAVRRLVVIPHGLLHLVPFWALSSLAHLEVTVAPAAAHLVASRQRQLFVHPSALVVADPTLDLSLTRIEAVAVATHLSKAGFAVRSIDGTEADKVRVTSATHEASLLHFSGHGRSDILNPSGSGLEVFPDFARFGLTGNDPLADLARSVHWPPMQNHHRKTNASVDRVLHEKVSPYSASVERRLDSPHGTLIGTYFWQTDPASPGDLKEGDNVAAVHGRFAALAEIDRHGRPIDARPVRLAELWTVGDVLASGAFKRCRLMFLSSCDAALGGISHQIDEFAGLPAAFELAGVRTVIAPLWRVDAAAAVLFADFFYQALCESSGRIDVVALVARAREQLRTLSRARAAERLAALGRQTGAPLVAFVAEAAAHLIAEGPEQPFAHPYDWAAFHVSGVTGLRLDRGSFLDRVRVAVANAAENLKARVGLV